MNYYKLTQLATLYFLVMSSNIFSTIPSCKQNFFINDSSTHSYFDTYSLNNVSNNVLIYTLWASLFYAEMYFIHKYQHHLSIYGKKHQVHHANYNCKNITEKKLSSKGLLSSLDQYFYTSVFLVIPLNTYLTWGNHKPLIFMSLLGCIDFLLHSQYHKANSIFRNFFWFKWLKNKHQIHHQQPKKNFFLVNPLFDWMLGTYQG